MKLIISVGALLDPIIHSDSIKKFDFVANVLFTVQKLQIELICATKKNYSKEQVFSCNFVL